MVSKFQKKAPFISRFQRNSLTVSHLLKNLHPQGPAFLWESSQVRRKASIDSRYETDRYSFLGFNPSEIIVVHHDLVIFTTEGKTRSVPLSEYDNNPLSPLKEAINAGKDRWLQATSEAPFDALPPFIGGGVGYLGYDASRYFEAIRGASGHPTQPDGYYLLGGDIIVLDNQTDTGWLISWENNESTKDRHLLLVKQIEEISSKEEEMVAASSSDLFPYHVTFSKQEFITMVHRAQEYIRAGDIFQVVLANELTINCSPDPVTLYQILKSLNPSPYHFLIQGEGEVIVGASPEVMLKSDRNSPQRVSMRPVAGTYPKDSLKLEEFQADPKERAEHIMLVDLARNDLGKVSEIGSVKVTDLCSIESYLHVHHLVSEIGGVLDESQDVFSALQSCFPIGTLAGTPKIRAMEIISELEGPARGVFGGAVLMVGFDEVIDSGVAIRFATIREGITKLRVGSGIVYDSDPEREYEECLWKAHAILRALSGKKEKKSASKKT